MMIIKCCSCSKFIKGKGRRLKTCKECGKPVCHACGDDGYCKECHPHNTPERSRYDYFKDKYSLSAQKTVVMLLLLALFALLSIPDTSAITFGKETLNADITSFEWCFDNPWGYEKPIYGEEWRPYIDNLGCSGVEGKLYMEYSYDEQVEVCTLQTDQCELVTSGKSANGTQLYKNSCTTTPGKCTNITIPKKDYYDVTQNDIMIRKADRLCYKGTRKANSPGNCDMNFEYASMTNASEAFLTVDYGKAWWNVTFLRKYSWTADNVSGDDLQQPFRIVIDVDDGDCSDDDIRWVNSAEDDVFGHNSTTNNTHVIGYVNESLATDLSGYLYCNASGVSSTSVPFPELELLNVNLLYVSLDDTSLSGNLYTPENTPTAMTMAAIGDTVTGLDGVFGQSIDVDGAGKVYNDTVAPVMDAFAGFTLSAWVNGSGTWATGAGTSTSNGLLYGIFAPDGFYRCHACEAGEACWWAATTVAEGAQFTHITCRFENSVANTINISVYVNGTYIASGTRDSPNLLVSDPLLGIGANDAGTGYANGAWSDSVDEVALFNGSLTDRLLQVAMNSTHPFYAEPNVTAGAGEDFETQTNLVTGLYNLTLDNISTSVDQRQDFIPWANYTFDANGTSIDDTLGFCNYSADNIVDPNFEQQLGVNTTVCNTGCDSTNRTASFTGLDLEGFVSDQYEVTLCHAGNPRRDFSIGTNCSGETYDFPFQDIPLCSAGAVMVRIPSQNCSGIADVNLSVWSEATAPGHALTIVNDTLRLDRTHNHTEDLTWNASRGVWLDDDAHHYDVVGEQTINISCFHNTSGVQNQSEALTITVANVAPDVLIDGIWWWLLTGFEAFDDGEVAKYPLENTLNISSECSNGDLDTIIHYLNYTNGTNIHTHDAGSTNTEMNYTASNFTVNENRVFQTWCNDTGGLITSSQKTFNASNLAPTVTWDNASVSVGATPFDLNWTCADAENEASFTSYLWINNTNVSDPNVTTAEEGYVFNLSANTYNFSVRCEDTFFNSSNAELNVSFQPFCATTLSGLSAGERYNSLSRQVGLNCSNGVALTGCWWSYNNYAPERVENCTSFNISLETGKNDMEFIYDDTFNTTTTFSVWARDPGANVFGFVLLWVSLLLYAGMFILGALSGVGLFYIAASVFGVIVGMELFALSSALGLVVGFILLCAGVIMTILKN